MRRPPTFPTAIPPLRSVFRTTLRLRRHQSSSSGSDRNPPSSTNATDTARSESIPVPNTVSPLPLWQRLGPLTAVATAYARAQKRRPWGTQFVSALVIYGLADVSAQNIGSDDDIDPKRTARSLVIGGIAAIPSYLWYVVPVAVLDMTCIPTVSMPSMQAYLLTARRFIWLSHRFNYSSHLLSLATKISVSQLLFAPIFNTYFFGAQAALAGCSPAAVVDRIVQTVPTSVVNSCQFWPLVTAFTFTFIPIEYRSVFSGVIAIGWQTYLALLNRRAERRADHIRECS
jgi:hypothetical protein